MISLLLAAAIGQAEPSPQEFVNRFCARVVGVPYATDNITDDQWERFSFCVKNLIPVETDTKTNVI